MQIEPPSVMRLGHIDSEKLASLLSRFNLELVHCKDGSPIPGSYWGDDEAGLVADRLYARIDTPLHSILHEACHYICLSPDRRLVLHTDAGSDDAEENAVCYLQVILAGYLEGLGQARIFDDMDAWGYSFRLGSSRAWFETDADDARRWLLDHGLIDQQQQPGWRVRE